MKLIFNENLSPKLSRRLRNFPDSLHVRNSVIIRMKLIFNENLSPKLSRRLRNFPDSLHVRNI
jgi:predicted nuclease of predicted toxin-antitoxin system